MEIQTAITLLTIAVILLSVVIVAILALGVVLLFKVNKLVRNANHITNNIVSATAWLSPVKVFGEAFKAFNKFRS